MNTSAGTAEKDGVVDRDPFGIWGVAVNAVLVSGFG